MKKQLRRSSRKAQPTGGGASSAWWYEETRGISVYCYQVNGPTMSCFISARALESFLAKRRKK